MTNALNEAQTKAREWLRVLLDRMGYEAKIEAVAREGEVGVILQVSGEKTGELLSQGAPVFEALELLLQRALPRVTDCPEFRVDLDVDGCRQRRVDRLLQAARDAAERVMASGEPFAFDPLSASDRKLIHNALRYVPGVQTESGPPDERGHKRVTVRVAGPSATAS
jgi:spoIIIJ-associated protein